MEKHFGHAVLSLLAAIFIWSGNTLVSKLAVNSVPPGSISFWRWALAFVLLTPFCLKKTIAAYHQIIPRFSKLLVLGGLGMVVYQSSLYFGAADTTATNIGLLLGIMPVITMVLSACILGEHLGWKQVAGLLLSLAGLILVLTKRHPKSLFQLQVNPADWMVLAGVVGYALYTVLSKRWVMPFGLSVSLYVQIGCSVFMLLPFQQLAPAWQLDGTNALMIIYAAALASIVAPFCWLWGVTALGPARGSLFFFLLPVVTAALAVIVLNEQVHSYHISGGILAFAGLKLALQKKASKAGEIDAVLAD